MSRIVKTPFFSKIAEEIISAVFGQLSDGWGENNPRNDRWWLFANVRREPNGQVAISVSEESAMAMYGQWVQNGFCGMTDAEILKKIASWIKKTAKMELDYNGVNDGWRRSNEDFKTAYLNYHEDISIAHAYLVYDVLSGRDPAGKFTVRVYDSVFGKPKTEEETRAEQSRRDDIAALFQTYQSENKAICDWEKNEVERLEQQIREIKKDASCRRDALHRKYVEDKAKLVA